MNQFSVVSCGSAYTAARLLLFEPRILVRHACTGRLMMHPFLHKSMLLCNAVVTCLKYAKAKFSFVGNLLRRMADQDRYLGLGARAATRLRRR